MDQPAQPGFALDDAVGNSHLAAQGWQENHQLKGKGVLSYRGRTSLCAGCQPGLWQLLSVKKLVLLFTAASGEEIQNIIARAQPHCPTRTITNMHKHPVLANVYFFCAFSFMQIILKSIFALKTLLNPL